MITDQFCIFFDDKAAAASDTSSVVHVGLYAGRGCPIYVSALVKGANAAAVSVVVTIQESADGSTWNNLGTVNIHKPDELPALEAFELPLNLKDRQVRLSYALTGTATGLTIWAGVTREHFAPYAEGQFIDHGKVVA